MHDAGLARALAAGDRDAFATLFDRYAEALHDFCASVLRNRDEARDAVQDTFVLAWERVGQLRDPSKLKPWLFAIARREALRRLQARRRWGDTMQAASCRPPHRLKSVRHARGEPVPFARDQGWRVRRGRAHGLHGVRRRCR